MKEADAGRDNGGWCIGKSRYKAWALAVILLLAFWSMLSGSAGLARKWSAHNPFAVVATVQDKSPDALEMEVREKIVRHAWDRYRYNPRVKLSNFWHDAFEAAFDELDSENPVVKDDAVKEIARLSSLIFQVDLNTGKAKHEARTSD